MLLEFDLERDALQICDALHSRQITSEIKETRDDRFSLWVHEEDQLALARDLIEAWRAGDGVELAQAAEEGRRARKDQQRGQAREQQEAKRAQQAFDEARSGHAPAMSFGLIALCVGIHLLWVNGSGEAVFQALTIMEPDVTHVTRLIVGPLSFTWLPLPWNEPWRIFTPVLMHSVDGTGLRGLLSIHLIFNMMMLGYLGPRIETRHGSLYLAAFVILAGSLSNMLQYEVRSSPGFLGFSGVNYALLGLAWMRQRLPSPVDYGISDGTFQFLMLWMALGFMEELGSCMGLSAGSGFSMANWCHLGGLLVGFAWARVASRVSAR